MLVDEIKFGESVNIEFKREVPQKSEKYIKSVIAFANTAGGKIVIGIDDETHEIVGVEKDGVFKIIDNITNTISDMCCPQIFPNIGVNTIDGKSVIVINIYPGANRPYYIKSLGKETGTYIRVSGTSRPADEAAKSNSEKEKIKDVTVQNLINWGVVKNMDGTLLPTNAFVLLTDNVFPFAKIQCALFKGTERVVFIDKRDFEGPLYEQIEEAYDFVLKHINLGAEIKDLVRNEAYELPTEAIREAIVNAVTHRNFLDRACVQVAVYDDRVEVTSPGMLYGGLTIEQIKEGGSKIRNRCIAEVFSRMRIIESWGTGIKRMFSSCREYGIRDPELLEIGDSFRVNLYRPSYSGNDAQSSPKSSPKSSSKSSPKSSPNGLNATQQKIMQMIRKNSRITQAEMAEIIKISRRAVQKNIKELVDQGIIIHEGSTRNGYWKIKE